MLRGCVVAHGARTVNAKGKHMTLESGNSGAVVRQCSMSYFVYLFSRTLQTLRLPLMISIILLYIPHYINIDVTLESPIADICARLFGACSSVAGA